MNWLLPLLSQKNKKTKKQLMKLYLKLSHDTLSPAKVLPGLMLVLEVF